MILNGEKEKSASTVAKLSQFLRYTLYESNVSKVATEKEIQLLKDYIAMESIRLNLTKVCADLINDGSIATLPPLLMLPVIENAFKYARDAEGKEINIDLTIENKKLSVVVTNEMDLNREGNDNGGIGLKNFKKRLELYYPGKFEYRIVNSGNSYTAIINIET